MSRLAGWWLRLRHFVLRREEQDLDEELAFHLDRMTEEYIASGMSPAEAHRQARIAFGGVERSRQECRESRPGFWIEVLGQDVRYALRGFRRNPVFTLAVVLTMMLGIGATAAVFSVVDRILFRPLPYAQADRLVSVGLVAPVEPQEFMLGGSYYEWKDHQRPFASLTQETGVSPCDLTEERPMRLSCAGVEANFLSTLGVTPMLGKSFTKEEDLPNAPKTALISYKLWQVRFGRDQDVLERLIKIDGAPVRVIGVLPKDFEMPRLQEMDVMLPSQLDETAQRRADPGRPMWAFARLKPGVTVEQAKQELQPVFDYSLKLAPAPFRKEVHLAVRSLRDRQMHDVRRVAIVLVLLVAGLLLIVCANVTGLMLARRAAREREIAMRSALGASRMRLLRQGLTESLLLAVIGGALGCGLAVLLLRVFVAAAPEGVPMLSKARVDLRIAGMMLAVSGVCAVVAGLATALRKPNSEALTGRAGTARSFARLRQWLVVGQIGTSLVLLVGGGLLFRSFMKLEHQRLGMETERVVTASLSLGQRMTPQQTMAFYRELERRMRYEPGIMAVAISDTLPPGGFHHDQIYASIAIDHGERPASGTGGRVTWRWVTPEYFRALNIPIIAGEGFTSSESESQQGFVVLSRRLAQRMFPKESAVGHTLRLAGWGTENNPRYTVVGVVEDVKNAGLRGGDEPEYYRLLGSHAEDWSRGSAVILTTTLPPDAVKRWLEEQVAALDPTVPVKVQTMQERVNRMADRPRFESLLVGFFATIGLLLAVIGLYGVIAFLVAQRTQEIGVRMALGAARGDILRLVMGRSLRLIVAGVIAGLLAALAVSKILTSMLFGVGSRDPMTYSLATLSLVVVALAATLVPARSASRVDPAEALRNE
ncbi:ABC transporter permease [Edaphobacter sp. 12200R-103]|uniref:ABC transporter permease n=1 Tax=Edaphobacter sp. 12200R-103 TaxID=2703788 RepID=UPI00138B1D03|nr:ABC transporter permease [Edaphobacter sp. 12200R-103]QHS52825.1 ABC transporter permease [Edaphobacter sp. 12200R-103]